MEYVIEDFKNKTTKVLRFAKIIDEGLYFDDPDSYILHFVSYSDLEKGIITIKEKL